MSDDIKTAAPQWKQVEPFQDVHKAIKPNIQSGTAYSERVPKLPFQYFLDNAGNLVRVALGSTRNLKGAAEAGADPLRTINFMRNKAIRDGFIPWEYVDAKAYTPYLVGIRSREQWEMWREEELQRRRKEHNERSSSAHSNWAKDVEERKADILAEAMSRIVDAKLAAIDPKKKKGE